MTAAAWAKLEIPTRPHIYSSSWRLFPLELEALTGEQVTIHEASDLPVRYAVRRRGWCLDKGGAWELEPQPSSRDDDFIARCRWDSWEDAGWAAMRAAEEILRELRARATEALAATRGETGA